MASILFITTNNVLMMANKPCKGRAHMYIDTMKKTLYINYSIQQYDPKK